MQTVYSLTTYDASDETLTTNVFLEREGAEDVLAELADALEVPNTLRALEDAGYLVRIEEHDLP